MHVPDNYDLFVSRELRQQRWLDSRPVCSCCGDPIQDDHCYKHQGEIICPACMELEYRVEIED